MFLIMALSSRKNGLIEYLNGHWCLVNNYINLEMQNHTVSSFLKAGACVSDLDHTR